jgi:CheY-like chemotaxis protein
VTTRVLIAEDEAIIRLDLRETLEEEGYEVVGETGRGDEAVRLAHELRPDLAILDIKMPGLDGLSAAREIAGERCAVPKHEGNLVTGTRSVPDIDPAVTDKWLAGRGRTASPESQAYWTAARKHRGLQLERYRGARFQKWNCSAEADWRFCAN